GMNGERRADTRGDCGRRAAANEPAQVRGIAREVELERREQVLHDGRVTRPSRDPNHPRFLSGRRAEERFEQCAAMAAASTFELETCEPKLVPRIERAKQSETHRRRAAVTPVGPEDIARYGNRFHSAGAWILFDEIAA